jgi:hypothetical protein
LNLALIWQVPVPARELALDGGRARKRLGDRAEVCKHSITGIVNDPALMLFYGVADDVEIFAQPAVSAFLVLPGEAGVTRHIRIGNPRVASERQ